MKSCEEILESFKITPTAQRKELLNFMLRQEAVFSLEDIKQATIEIPIVISDNTINQTLLLFEARHLIYAKPSEKREGRKGRPPLMYSINKSLKDNNDL